jgi:hypothetical protein
MKKLSAIYCGHANENPSFCPCPENCYCKDHTCKDKMPELSDKFKQYVSQPDDCICANQQISTLLDVIRGSGIDKIKYIKYSADKIEISYVDL